MQQYKSWGRFLDFEGVCVCVCMNDCIYVVHMNAIIIILGSILCKTWFIIKFVIIWFADWTEGGSGDAENF